MTISVSVLSHAFFTERGAARASSGAEPCSVSVEDPDAGASTEIADCRNERKDCTPREHERCTPRELATQTSAKAHGRKRGNRKRGARGRQNGPEREAKMHIAAPEVQDRTPSSLCENAAGVAEVLVRDIREECSSALGIVKEDLELYGLCHLPRTSERARLLKDRSGVMHVGVMVRNSDLSLRTMEELVIHKDKAEEEVESCHAQIREKVEDLLNLKVKYDKLTEEVLRLRTMVNRANHLRRESEKATEILRVEFEKLVKSLFMERADCAEESLNDVGEA